MLSVEADLTVLGIDYGEKNIGLAFGRAGLASPIKTISGINVLVAINEITLTALHNKVNKIVIGLPIDVDGKETYKSLKVRRFANLLKRKTTSFCEILQSFGHIKSAFSLSGI